MLSLNFVAGFTDLYLQWRRPFEVLSTTLDLGFEKDTADGMPYVAAAHIMDDDLESAEDGLASGNSSFHKVRQMILLGCLGSRLIGFGAEGCWLMKNTLIPIAGKGHGCFLKSYAWFRAGNNTRGCV